MLLYFIVLLFLCFTVRCCLFVLTFFMCCFLFVLCNELIISYICIVLYYVFVCVYLCPRLRLAKLRVPRGPSSLRVFGVLLDTLTVGLHAGYARLRLLALLRPQALPVLTSTHFSLNHRSKPILLFLAATSVSSARLLILLNKTSICVGRRVHLVIFPYLRLDAVVQLAICGTVSHAHSNHGL